MANRLPILDRTLFAEVNKAEEWLEAKLDCHMLFFYGEIRSGQLTRFRNFVEDLIAECKQNGDRKANLAICLTTPGGEAEAVEKMVEIVRHHYAQVYFIVPSAAFSAGTIFCMSGDKIYMDYSSSLGPIDPQVPDKENKYLVPALGYIDKVGELVKKSQDGTIAPAEIAILARQDLAMLRFYEQARDLSIALLKEWLAVYKFKDWSHHRTNNPGTPVTTAEKKLRAEEIAKQLSDHQTWHSHGRHIGMSKLKAMRLEIDDFGADVELQKQIRIYNDVLIDLLENRAQIEFFLHNRRLTF